MDWSRLMRRLLIAGCIACLLLLASCTDGNQERIEDAYREGYNDGNRAGYNEGYEAGYDNGYYEGWKSGINDPDVRSDIFIEGYNEGYREGRNDGIKGSEKSISELIDDLFFDGEELREMYENGDFSLDDVLAAYSRLYRIITDTGENG